MLLFEQLALGNGFRTPLTKVWLVNKTLAFLCCFLTCSVFWCFIVLVYKSINELCLRDTCLALSLSRVVLNPAQMSKLNESYKYIAINPWKQGPGSFVAAKRANLHVESLHCSVQKRKQRIFLEYSLTVNAFLCAYAACFCKWWTFALTKNYRMVTFYNEKLKQSRYWSENRFKQLKNRLGSVFLCCTIREEARFLRRGKVYSVSSHYARWMRECSMLLN